MKIRRIVFAGLFLIAGLNVTTAQVKLSFNPEKGKKYEYQSEMIQNIQQNVMGQTIPMELEMNIKYLMEIKGKTSQETQMQYTYKEVAYIINSPMMKMGYDSKNPIENPSEMDKIFSKIFSTLIDESFMIVVAPDGTITSVTGMELIAEKMVNAISGDGTMAAQLGAQMKMQFGDDAIKNSFQQAFKIYPANPVKKGDSWNLESKTTISNMNTDVKTKYSLKDISKNLATITFESVMELIPTEGMEGNLSGSQTGTMIVDTKTGMTITSDVSQNMKGNVKAQGFDVQMEVDGKVKISTKDVK